MDEMQGNPQETVPSLGAGKSGRWGSTSHLALKEKMEEIFIETEDRVLWRVPANWSYILGSFDIAST